MAGLMSQPPTYTLSVMTPLQIAAQHGISYDQLNTVVNNSVKSIRKAYSFTGCYTSEDLNSTGWLGAISAITQPKFASVENKLAYIYVFARGYQTHALHRKSRVLRVPWDDIKSQKPGTAHLSYSWGNLPEPSYEENPDKALYDLVNMLSETDEKKILAGKEPSELGKQIVKKLTELVNA
jgi:hypothetical protein